MYLWRKSASKNWLSAREMLLQARVDGKLAIVARPGRKRLQLEAACASRNESRNLIREFGGHAKRLRRDWLNWFAREEKRKPLRVGKRLFIGRRRSSGFPAPKAFGVGKPSLLVVPASTAFGTGDHATTAMSLRLLEQLTRRWKPGWSMVDLGTGSGILALAAKCFGARRVVAVDVDPRAISTAKQNARLNKIDNIAFRVADVRHFKTPHGIDIVTANLFSELLIDILPKLKRARWLILSGIFWSRQEEFVCALRRRKIDIVELRRRGKWIAVLASCSGAL